MRTMTEFNLESFDAVPGELSTLMPASFAEFQLRVFTKDKRLVIPTSFAFCDV